MLDGKRVVAFGEYLPLQYALSVMRDLGADVIVVEPPRGVASRDFITMFDSLTGGQRSVALDLKTEGGKRAGQAVVATADVIIESYRPGKLEALGFGYDSIRALKPDVVYISLSGYGQTGPYRDRPGHELSYQGVAGLLDPNHGARLPGEVSRSWATPMPVGDFISGTYTVLAAAMGLLRRMQTGQGSYVDVAMTDCLLTLMSPQVCAVLSGASPPPMPPGDPAHGVYTTSDGRELTVSIAFEDHFWGSLCAVLGFEGAEHLSAKERVSDETAIRKHLAAAFSQRPRDEWLELLTDAGVPCGPVNSLSEVGDDPQVHAREMIRAPRIGSMAESRKFYMSQPLRFDGYEHRVRGPAPRLGEHTIAVLRESGLTEKEIYELVGDGNVSSAVAARGRSSSGDSSV